MAMTTRVAELATAFSSAVAVQSRGTTLGTAQVVKVQPVGGACRRSPGAAVAVNASQRQMAEEDESASKRTLMSTAMALAGAAIVAGGLAGSAEAAMQKVEGTERETQDAVTTGIREPSKFSAARSNSVQEAAKINTQASGGTILGAPKLETPGGAYRSPQSSTYGVEETGGKRSTPAGILQGTSEGKTGSEDSEAGVIGGDARE